MIMKRKADMGYNMSRAAYYFVCSKYHVTSMRMRDNGLGFGCGLFNDTWFQ